MVRKTCKAQALVDYIMVFAAVVLLIAAFAYTQLRGGVSNMFTQCGTAINNAATSLNSGTGPQ